MLPESPVATSFKESLGSKKGKYGLRDSVSGIVVHTTGAGPVRRHQKDPKKFKTPFEAAVHVYTKIYPPGPHYVVGQGGECIQVCREELAAWHVGSSQSAAYKNLKGPWTKKCKWWLERWQPLGLSSPLDLPVWGPTPSTAPAAVKRLSPTLSCNAHTIGIEVVPPIKHTAAWSEDAQDTLWELITELCHRHNIPCDAFHVVSHSDAHPLSRTNGKGQPWDPSLLQWTGPSAFPLTV